MPNLSLTSIMDAIFSFIFFLLFSVTFIKIYEVPSDVPMSTNQPPPTNEKPLALTLKVEENGLSLYKGVPSQFFKQFGKLADGKYDLLALHDFLVTVKKEFPKEESIVIEPIFDIEYESIINIMDAVRLIKNTDESIYRPGKDGISEKIETLFGNVVFGNLLS